jgi:hypothetical protein
MAVFKISLHKSQGYRIVTQSICAAGCDKKRGTFAFFSENIPVVDSVQESSVGG